MNRDHRDKQETGGKLPSYSVSRLAAGYHKGCEKLLKKYGQYKKGHAPIPLRVKAAQERGIGYEEVLAGDLGMLVDDHTHTPSQYSKNVLRAAKAGQILYQLRITMPDDFQQEFFRSYRLNEFIPDFLLIKKKQGSNIRKICVVDAKSSVALNSHHQFQVASYAFLISHLIRDICDLEVDAFAGVWLQSKAEPTYFRVDLMLNKIKYFYTVEIPRTVANPSPKWLYGPKCRTCEYSSRCREDSYGTPGAIAYIDQENLDAIHETMEGQEEEDVTDIEDLANDVLHLSLKDKMQTAVPPYLSKRPEYSSHNMAYHTNKAQESFAPKPIFTIPRFNDHEIFLTAIHNPSETRLCSYSITVYDARTEESLDYLMGIGHVKPSVTRGAYLAMNIQLLDDLDRVMNHMEKIESRCTIFFPSVFIKDIVQDAIFDVVAAHHLGLVDDMTGRKGQRCLLALFQSTRVLELPDTDTSLTSPQTDAVVSTVCNIDAVIQRNVILGVPGFYTLDDLAKWLFPFNIPTVPDDDTLYEAWATKEHSEVMDMLVVQAIVYREVVYSIKAMADDYEASTSSEIYCLESQPFRWPPTLTFRSPILGKLAVFATQESVAEYQKERASRYNDIDDKTEPTSKGLAMMYLGYTVEDRPSNKRKWLYFFDPVQEEGIPLKLLTDAISPSASETYLLVPNDREGTLQAIRFSDMMFRNKLYIKVPITIATVERKEENGKIFVLSGFMKDLNLVRGHEYRLYKRYTDYSIDKIMSVLLAINDKDDSVVEDVIRDPNAWSMSALPDDVMSAEDERTMLHQAKHEFHMSDSQCEIAASIIKRRLQIIWGPPGSGKTEFLALFFNCYIKYLARPYPGTKHYLIGVTALTRLAIRNLVERIAKVQKKVDTEFTILYMDTRDAVLQGKGQECVKLLESQKLKSTVAALAGPVVIAGTVWDWYKAKRLWKTWEGLDCLIIDEASQMLVSNAIVGIDCLNKERGRLIVAGDHLQLGPIRHTRYPPFSPDEPRLFGSIQDCLMRTSENKSIEVETMFQRKTTNMDFGPNTAQLMDNWRMNRTLNAFFSQVYGKNYKSKYPDQALDNDWSLWEGAQEKRELMEKILDPTQCITIVKVPDNVDDIEAKSISKIIEAYQATRIPKDAEKESLYDVMVLAPHHWQRIAVNRELGYCSIEPGRVMVHTVEKMQGQECDLVLACFAYSNVKSGDFEFLLDFKRWNVALSRARCKVIIITTEHMLSLSSKEGYDTMELFEKSSEGWAFVQMAVEWATKSGSIMDWREFDN